MRGDLCDDPTPATRRIVADPDLEHTRVLVLTTFELDEYVFDALRYGASGFPLKTTPRPTSSTPSARSTRGEHCWHRR